MTRSGVSLRTTLVSLTLGLIVLATLGVGLAAYLTSRRIVTEAWRELSEQIAKGTAAETRRYLEPAVPYLDLTRALVRQGRLDPGRREALFAYFVAALRANAGFSWASFGSADGTYLAVRRRRRGRFRASWREQVPGRAPGPRARLRDYDLAPDGSWSLVSESWGSYDPRVRPWYRAAAARPDGIWVEPFVFATRRVSGFVYAQRDTARDGRLRGVWAVEYEAQSLSPFLARARIGETGRVFVVTREGVVVGHPRGAVTVEAAAGGGPRVARAAEHPDPMLAQAWRGLRARGGGAQSFSVGSHLVMAQPLPAEARIDWTVLVVVPRDELFGDVRNQALAAAGIAACFALLAIGLGVLFASRVSMALDGIAGEMERVGRFDLAERPTPARTSAMRELRAMGDVTARMKRSLRSFGKYVPVQLVQDLMRSGREADLGVQRRRVTTMFVDMAGFTALTEVTDPDLLIALLGEFLGETSKVVHAHEGTVDKYIGDAVMAFWGAPREQVDSAPRACRAALAVRARVRMLCAEWEAQGRPSLHARQGIATGEALVGNIGSPQRMNYTVMGDTVNLASRLESLNKLYHTDILIDAATAREVADSLLVRPVDWVSVVGRVGGGMVYALVDTQEAAGPEVRRACELHGQALLRYRARDFVGAVQDFEEVQAILGGADGPARVLAERCSHYRASPPPPAWDGVFLAEVK